MRNLPLKYNNIIYSIVALLYKYVHTLYNKNLNYFQLFLRIKLLHDYNRTVNSKHTHNVQ
jgi:hypothetical protein